MLETEIRPSSEAGQLVPSRVEVARNHHLPDALKEARLLAARELGDEIVIRQTEVAVTVPQLQDTCLIVGRMRELLGEEGSDLRVHLRKLRRGNPGRSR